MAQIINYEEAKNKIQTGETKKSENERCNNILRNLEEKRENFTTSLIIKTAEDILKATGFYNRNIAIPINKIVKNFGITPYKEKMKKSNIYGCLYVNGTTIQIYRQDKIIIVNKNNSTYFNRFIVARQLAVFLLNFKENDGYSDKQKVFIDEYKDEYCKDYQRFATEILMPTDMFIKQHDIAVEEDNRRIFVIMYLSRYFEVPEYFVERRIYELTH